MKSILLTTSLFLLPVFSHANETPTPETIYLKWVLDLRKTPQGTSSGSSGGQTPPPANTPYLVLALLKQDKSQSSIPAWLKKGLAQWQHEYGDD